MTLAQSPEIALSVPTCRTNERLLGMNRAFLSVPVHVYSGATPSTGPVGKGLLPVARTLASTGLLYAIQYS